MSLTLPDELVWVLDILGFNWPMADEDKLRDAATAWRNFGRDVDNVRRDVDQIVNQVARNNTGEAIDAYVALAKEYQNGDGGHLHDASMAAGIVGEALELFADAVVVMKVAVIAQIAILAGEIIATQGAAIVTFGAAEAALPEEIGLTQFIVSRIKHELIQKVEQEILNRVKAEAKGQLQRLLEADLLNKLQDFMPPGLQPAFAMAATGAGRRGGHRGGRSGGHSFGAGGTGSGRGAKKPKADRRGERALASGKVPAFDKAGVPYTGHFAKRVAQRSGRGVTGQRALDAYNRGTRYFDPASSRHIRYDRKTGTAVVLLDGQDGPAHTIFEQSNPSARWNHVPHKHR